MLRRALMVSVLAVAVTSIAGCGFQLRGLSHSVMQIDSAELSTNISPLSEEVRRTLIASGVNVVDQAKLRINLGDERVSQRRLTRADTGSRESELTLTAPFSVQRTEDNAYLLNQQQIEVATTILTTSDNVYSSDEVQKQAVQQLRRDAANQLMDRLAAIPAQ